MERAGMRWGQRGLSLGSCNSCSPGEAAAGDKEQGRGLEATRPLMELTGGSLRMV